MDDRNRRKIIEILRALAEADKPLGGARIAQTLALAGADLSQRTIRHHLAQTDREGLTANLGRRGRVLTALGRQELEGAYALDKVGFVAAKVDALSYGMHFRLRQGNGSLVVNFSVLPLQDMPRAAPAMALVYQSGLGMGNYIKIIPPGNRLGRLQLGQDQCGVVTICSITVNGILLNEGIPTTSRFGGLLQMSGGRPRRFVELIHYDGTTLDPLEIFIKSQMTSVAKAARGELGLVGASFREIPAPSAEQVRRLQQRMERLGLKGILIMGRPGQALLDVPVAAGRIGIVVIGGLNPLAAVEEAGIATLNRAMGALLPLSDLMPYDQALAPWL